MVIIHSMITLVRSNMWAATRHQQDRNRRCGCGWIGARQASRTHCLVKSRTATACIQCGCALLLRDVGAAMLHACMLHAGGVAHS
jgi:hypothetical protein